MRLKEVGERERSKGQSMIWVKKSILKYNTHCCTKWLRQQLFKKLCWGTKLMIQNTQPCHRWAGHVVPDTSPSECFFGCVHILSYTAVSIGEDIGIYRKCTKSSQSSLLIKKINISFRDAFCLKFLLSNFLTLLLAQEHLTKQEISIVPSERPEPAHRVHMKKCDCYRLFWTLLQSHFHITEGKAICCWGTPEYLIKYHCFISTACF